MAVTEEVHLFIQIIRSKKSCLYRIMVVNHLWCLKTWLNKGESLNKWMPSYGLRHESTEMIYMKNLNDIVQYAKEKAEYRISYTCETYL
jgi:hypothetical protein